MATVAAAAAGVRAEARGEEDTHPLRALADHFVDRCLLQLVDGGLLLYSQPTARATLKSNMILSAVHDMTIGPDRRFAARMRHESLADSDESGADTDSPWAGCMIFMAILENSRGGLQQHRTECQVTCRVFID